MVLASIFGPLDGLERSPNRGTGRDASLNAFGLTKPLTIARGRPDDHRTGLSFSAGRSIVDHGFCDTVLDAASGIEVFEFAEQVGLQPFALLNSDEIQRRCFPDQLVLKI